MKHLKKHPKQQRKEDMTFPIQKRTFGIHKTLNTRCIHNTFKSFSCARCKKKFDKYGVYTLELEKHLKENVDASTQYTQRYDKVIWEGREWLRSINDPNHERRMVGVMCLVLAVLYAVAVYVLL